MIDLTPLEVRKKKGDFRRAMRGYEPALVDDFLDVAADRLEQLVRENMALQEKVAELTAHVTEFRDRERALTEALVSAQGLREELRRQAAREIELAKHSVEEQAKRERAAMEQELQRLRANAAQRASDALEDIREVRAREEELLRELRARQQEFLLAYRGFLEDELGELDTIARAAGIALAIKQSDGADDPFEPEEFIAPEDSVGEPRKPQPATGATAAQSVTAAHSATAAQSMTAAQSATAAQPAAAPSVNGIHADAVADEHAVSVRGPDARQSADNAWPQTPDWSSPELELVESASDADAIDLDAIEFGTADTIAAEAGAAGADAPESHAAEIAGSEPQAAGNAAAEPHSVATPGTHAVDLDVIDDIDAIDLDVVEEEDPETTILLRNAAAAGYQLDEEELPDELLLDETVTDDLLDTEEDDGWLPSLLDDDK